MNEWVESQQEHVYGASNPYGAERVRKEEMHTAATDSDGSAAAE